VLERLLHDVFGFDFQGLPGLVLREADGAIDTMAFEHRDSRIIAIYVTRNPDRPRHVRF
jgi:RNA polymerase sigma-70 factor, ECF subfamily